jgi:hypothetical protein
MANKYPTSTEYFCGNCEDEVNGLPVGCRILSGRPLCLRCTQIGIEEGWAEPQKLEPETRIYESGRKPGIMVMGFFMTVLILVIGAVLLLVAGPARNR